MELTVNIGMDNAAFEPHPGDEAARILRNLADKLDGVDFADDYDCNIRLIDFNGNSVGTATVRGSRS